MERALCAPTFIVDGKPLANGAGFLLAVDGSRRSTYLFAAQHLISIPSVDMPTRVLAATCASVGPKRFPAGPALLIKGAHPMGPLASLRDVVVFPIRGPSPGLPLAIDDVSPGQGVWLLARVKGGVDTRSLLHHASVVRSGDFLAYSFDDRTLNLDQTSGGAVLNDAGEVVGLNIGYTRTGDGRLVGVADSLSVLRSVVDALP